MAVGSILFDIRAGVANLNSDFAKASKLISSKIGGIEGLFKKAAGALGLYMGGKALLGLAQGSIDAADNLAKLATKTGSTTETLSSLGYAAGLSGSSLEEVSKGLTKLATNMAEAAAGKDVAQTFRALGVSTKDASGQLRATDEVLGDVADRFAKMPNGAQKSALAVKLFGKSGADLIPLLNRGREGLADMRKEAESFGQVMSTEQARAAERFKDNLQRIKQASGGVVESIMGGLLPALEGVTQWWAESGKGADRYARITEVTSQVVDLLADSIDNLTIFIRMLVAPIRDALPSWDEFKTAVLAITNSTDGASLAMKTLTGSFKFAQIAGTVLSSVFTQIGKTLGAIGAAVVALFSGDFAEAKQIVSDWGSDIAHENSVAADKIAEIWSKSTVEVQMEAAKLSPGLRAGLDKMREASRAAAAEVRGGLTPAIEATSKAAEKLAKKLRDAGFETMMLVAKASEGRIGPLLAQLNIIRAQYAKEVDALKQAHKKGEIAEADYLAQRKARREIFAKEIAKAEREIARADIDAQAETKAIEASITKSKLDDLQVAYDNELEAVRRAEEDKTLTAEQANARRLALQKRYTKDVTEAMKEESKKAQAVGLGIADAIADGLKEGFTSDNFKDIFKSVLTMFSRIASLIPGGGLMGGISGIFAGLFADGGLIRGAGTGTSDSNLALVSDGEFINRAASVRKFGAKFFERLNEGVLDLSTLGRYATGGMIGEPAMAGAGAVGLPTSHTEIHLKSFDSVDALGGLRRTLGPATIYRNSLRQSEVERQSMSRWVR